MKYKAWHFDASPYDAITFEATDSAQAWGIAAHSLNKPADELCVVPLLAAPVEVEETVDEHGDTVFVIRGMDEKDAHDYLRLFNGAPRMLELLLEIAQALIETPHVKEAKESTALILGESK